MSYSKQGFHSGQILLAEHLISMEEGIISAVSFDAQELNETQKAQARRNIGITTDDTLTLEDVAADAKAVGIKFVGERNYTNNKIAELVDNAPENSNTLGKLASLTQKSTNELNTKINNINLESLGITIPTENLNQIPDTITDIQSRVNNSVSYTAQTLTDEQKAQARANIGAGTSDVKSWSELEGKPVVMASCGDTLTWDGDTEGKVTVSDALFKVSDSVPSLSDFSAGVNIGFILNDEIVSIDMSYDDISNTATDDGLIFPDVFVVVPYDNYDISEMVADEGAIMPEKGIYFLNSTRSITIPGYNFTQEKIDPKYIPSPDWNKIENKPFETVGGDTLTWDGDKTGKIIIMDMMCKVSDAIPAPADFTNGYSVVDSDGGIIEMAYDDLSISDDGMVVGEGFAVIPTDNYDLTELFGESFVAPEKGVYTFIEEDYYIASFTIPGYTGFTKEIIKQEVLPEALQFGEKPTGGDTLEWDGDITGRTVITLDDDSVLVKISDVAPSESDFVNGAVVTNCLLGAVSFQADQLIIMANNVYSVPDQSIVFIKEDNTNIEGISIEEAGTYFLKVKVLGMGNTYNYSISLTIPGYTGFPLVTPIEEKYIPDTVARKSDVDGNLIKFVTCDTAPDTKEKVATIQNGNPFILRDGTRITVHFTNENTATAPTLNVNDTGNIEIYWHGAPLTNTQYWQANAVLDFVYNGAQWEIVGVVQDNDTKNTAGSLNKASTKLYLIGATSQAADIQTNSNSACYIDTNNQLYSNNKAVSVSGHTHSASNITASGAFGAQVAAKSGKQAPGTSLLRNSAILSSLTDPTEEGEIYWLYE